MEIINQKMQVIHPKLQVINQKRQIIHQKNASNCPEKWKLSTTKMEVINKEIKSHPPQKSVE